MTEEKMIINGKEIEKPEPKTKKPFKLKKIFFGSPKRIKISLGLLAFLVIIAAGAIVYFLIYIPNRPVITINGQKIYKKDILKEQNLYSGIWKMTNNPDAKKNPYDTAKKLLIENTIITTESNKRGITVSQKETDDQYNQQSADYGSTQKYTENMQSLYGWSKSDTENDIRISLLKDKLTNVVLNAYSGSFLYVRYDVYGQNQKAVDVAKAKIDALRLQAVAGKNPYAIAKEFETDRDWHQPFMDAGSYEKINASNEKKYFEGREDWQNISKLNKPGEVSAVYKSSGGYYAFAVLRIKSNGAYDSWDAFVASFTGGKQVGVQKIAKKIANLYYHMLLKVLSNMPNVNQLSYILNRFNGVAKAIDCGASGALKPSSSGDCCVLVNGTDATRHKGTVIITVKSNGHPISGARVRMAYSGNNYSNICSSIINSWTTSFSGTTDGNGQVVFYNVWCWIHYNITASADNYYTSSDFKVLEDGSWVPTDNLKPLNGGSAQVVFNLTEKTWYVTPYSSVSPTTQVPGKTVVFTHWIHQNGPADTNHGVSGATQWTRRLDDTTKIIRGTYNIAAGWQAYTDKTPSASGSNPHTFTIPGSISDYTLDGKRYCQNINVDNPMGNRPGDAHGTGSTPACVTIHIPHWNIIPSSTVSATGPGGVAHNLSAGANTIFVNVGDTVKWTHNASVNGENTTRVVNLKSQWTTSPGGVLNDYAHPTDWSAASPYSYTYTWTVPGAGVYDASQDGKIYCQNITANPQAYNNLTELAGAQVCVRVTVPTPATYAPYVKGGDYEKGGTLPTFDMGATVSHPTNLALACGVLTGESLTWTNRGPNPAIDGTNTINGVIPFMNCGGSAVLSTVTRTLLQLGIAGSDAAVISKLDAAGLPYKITRVTSLSIGPATAAGYANAYQVPYARFYGNDIYARTGDIFFNKNTNPGPGMTGGASAVQYAAIAFDTVNINTNVFKGISPDLAAKWYNGQAPASPYDDVIANLPGNPKTPPSNPMDINGSSVTDNTYYNQVGDLSLGSNGNHHRRITIHATGDIYITTQLALPPGVMQNIKTKSDLATAPVLLIVSDKNIYIAPNVDQIDAILVAKGTVYTCATSATLPARAYTSPANPGWESSCNKKLTINGAVAAQNISFARSVGTRLKGNVNEPYNQPQGINTAAEVINFPSYLYYATPFLDSSSDSGYQSIFNAAPLL